MMDIDTRIENKRKELWEFSLNPNCIPGSETIVGMLICQELDDLVWEKEAIELWGYEKAQRMKKVAELIPPFGTVKWGPWP